MTKLLTALALCSTLVTGGTVFYMAQTAPTMGEDVIAELNFKQCHEMHQKAYNTMPYEAFDACTYIMQGKEVF